MTSYGFSIPPYDVITHNSKKPVSSICPIYMEDTIKRLLMSDSQSCRESNPDFIGTILKTRVCETALNVRFCFAKSTFLRCGPDRIRTGDLSIANAALYQLSYRPRYKSPFIY